MNNIIKKFMRNLDVNQYIVNRTILINSNIAKQTYITRDKINTNLNDNKLLGYKSLCLNLNKLNENVEIYIHKLLIYNENICFLFVNIDNEVLGFLYPKDVKESFNSNFISNYV
jgi:hypothetical protein